MALQVRVHPDDNLIGPPRISPLPSYSASPLSVPKIRDRVIANSENAHPSPRPTTLPLQSSLSPTKQPPRAGEQFNSSCSRMSYPGDKSQQTSYSNLSRSLSAVRRKARREGRKFLKPVENLPIERPTSIEADLIPTSLHLRKGSLQARGRVFLARLVSSVQDRQASGGSDGVSNAPAKASVPSITTLNSRQSMIQLSLPPSTSSDTLRASGDIPLESKAAADAVETSNATVPSVSAVATQAQPPPEAVARQPSRRPAKPPTFYSLPLLRIDISKEHDEVDARESKRLWFCIEVTPAHYIDHAVLAEYYLPRVDVLILIDNHGITASESELLYHTAIRTASHLDDSEDHIAVFAAQKPAMATTELHKPVWMMSPLSRRSIPLLRRHLLPLKRGQCRSDGDYIPLEALLAAWTSLSEPNSEDAMPLRHKDAIAIVISVNAERWAGCLNLVRFVETHLIVPGITNVTSIESPRLWLLRPSLSDTGSKATLDEGQEEDLCHAMRALLLEKRLDTKFIYEQLQVTIKALDGCKIVQNLDGQESSLLPGQRLRRFVEVEVPTFTQDQVIFGSRRHEFAGLSEYAVSDALLFWNAAHTDVISVSVQYKHHILPRQTSLVASESASIERPDSTKCLSPVNYVRAKGDAISNAHLMRGLAFFICTHNNATNALRQLRQVFEYSLRSLDADTAKFLGNIYDELITQMRPSFDSSTISYSPRIPEMETEPSEPATPSKQVNGNTGRKEPQKPRLPPRSISESQTFATPRTLDTPTRSKTRRSDRATLEHLGVDASSPALQRTTPHKQRSFSEDHRRLLNPSASFLLDEHPAVRPRITKEGPLPRVDARHHHHRKQKSTPLQELAEQWVSNQSLVSAPDSVMSTVSAIQRREEEIRVTALRNKRSIGAETLKSLAQAGRRSAQRAQTGEFLPWL